MRITDHKPTDLDSLKEQIGKHYQELSTRLQQVANFVNNEPMIVAVETMSTIAKKANVPLSTLSRFSNAMGFDGFSSMQTLFKEQYLNQPKDYRERIKKIWSEGGKEENSPQMIFNDFGNELIGALENFHSSVSPQKLERAVTLIKNAETVYIDGVRRAYPVAFYLRYALMKSGKDTVILEQAGGMSKMYSKKMGEKDILIAVTYSPYAPETTDIINYASEKNVPIIGITDNQLTSNSNKIDVCFEVHEGELMGFRSLNCSMYLAQVLVVSYISQEIDQSKV